MIGEERIRIVKKDDGDEWLRERFAATRRMLEEIESARRAGKDLTPEQLAWLKRRVVGVRAGLRVVR